MGKGGGGGGTTTVQKADPWSGVQPYLIGGSTETGIYPEAQRLYSSQNWTPGMQSLTDQQGQNIVGRAGQVQQAYNVGNYALGGGFDPNVQRVGNVSTYISANPTAVGNIAGVNPVGNIAGVNSVGNIAGVNSVGNIAGPQSINAERVAAQNIYAQMVDPTQAFGSMGGANPTSSIQQMLTGRANTSTLDPVVNSALTRMSQNFNEQVMPGLRNEAVAAGQYGSSRQGIAEGLATRGLAQSMGDMSANMYNNAYNTAQQNMYGTANNMAGLGLNNAQTNANRDLAGQTANAGNNLRASLANASNSLQAQTTNAANQLAVQQFNANLGLQNNAQNLQTQQFNTGTALQNNQNALNTQQFNANLGLQNNAQALQNNQFNARQINAGNQFNANLGLQNNTQAMQLAQQQLANRVQGLNLLGQGNQLQDQNYAQQMSLLDAPNQYNWNNLNRYASIVTPGAGLGGTSTSNQQTSTNPFSSALGGALGGAALAGALPAAWGVSSGMGALGGAALALLSDRRFKTDIERVGTLDNGLGVYRYRYKSGGPMQIGVMADEVKAVNPGAVINVDGVDYVNYGGI